MEVVVPVSDLHFSGVSAPSSPKRFAAEPFDFYCHYTSAPTSPTRAAAIFSHFNSIASSSSLHLSPSSAAAAGSSGVPFYWEVKPGTPKSPSSSAINHDDVDVEEFDFALGFSGRVDKLALPPPELITADELFEEGKIRTLKPPPRLQYPTTEDKSSLSSSPRSPRSPKSWGLWSPRRRGRADDKALDPFTAAMVEATRDRGRDRAHVSTSLSHSRSRKGSRSLSPLRGGGGETSFYNKSLNSPPPPPLQTPATSSGDALKGSGSKKWRLKDLLLFRSASEGRATGNRSKDPLQKYTLLSSTFKKKTGAEDLKNSSFRRIDGKESTRRTRAAAASPHELHYTANRAAAEELKKKTALPYRRQSLFSFLGFNTA